MTGTLPRTRLAVLTNPLAGNGGAKAVGRSVTIALQQRGAQVTQVTGSSREDAAAGIMAAAQDAPDAIISVGGDGTHHLAAQAAAATGVPLAIVPAGTGNDLARVIGLPLRDPVAAVDAALTAPAGPFDLGAITTADGSTQHFLTIAMAGFDSLVADRTNAMRWPRGRASYVVAIGLEYARLAPRPFRLRIDDELVEDDLILVAVGNTRSYGGDMRMCPEADPHDGRLDVTVIHGVRHPRLELPRILPRVFRGTHVQHPAVSTYRGSRIEIRARDLNAYADGDLAGALPATIEAVPGGVQLITAGTTTPPGSERAGQSAGSATELGEQRPEHRRRDHRRDIGAPGRNLPDQ